jgi:hypothetical protein
VSDDRVRELAERAVAGAMSAQGARKSAGAAGLSRDQWMEICWPLAEGMIAVSDGIDACGARIRAMFEADCQRRDEANKAFGMSVRGAREPHQTVPFDPDLLKLHASLGPHEAPPRVNGHGAFAPEGGHS